MRRNSTKTFPFKPGKTQIQFPKTNSHGLSLIKQKQAGRKTNGGFVRSRYANFFRKGVRVGGIEEQGGKHKKLVRRFSQYAT